MSLARYEPHEEYGRARQSSFAGGHNINRFSSENGCDDHHPFETPLPILISPKLSCRRLSSSLTSRSNCTCSRRCRQSSCQTGSAFRPSHTAVKSTGHPSIYSVRYAMHHRNIFKFKMTESV